MLVTHVLRDPTRTSIHFQVQPSTPDHTLLRALDEFDAQHGIGGAGAQSPAQGMYM